MNIYTSAKEAIARSISHNEIAILEAESPRDALTLIDNNENVTELDYADTNTLGEIDCWGKRLGEDFRLYIRRDNDAVTKYITELAPETRADIAARNWDEVSADALYVMFGARSKADMKNIRTLAEEAAKI